MKIDSHIHLAGTGCCNSGCWVSPKFRKRYTFRLLRLVHGISARQMETTIDRDWPEMISKLIAESEVDYGVALGFDGVFDPSTGAESRGKSQMIVPPEWVFRVCRENPGLLPGPSINPYRKDAVARLEYCIEQGAVLIKWLPVVQAIDPADSRLSSFYKLAAQARLPLLVHTGGERTFQTVAAEFGDLHRLRQPLEAGVPLICAHTATRVLFSSEPDHTETLLRLLQEYPHLWVDNSGICNVSRYAHLPHLARQPLIAERTLYGSDWPVLSNAFYYTKDLGLRKVIQLERERNATQRDIKIKRALGYPDHTLTNHSRVLANLDRWVARRDETSVAATARST